MAFDGVSAHAGAAPHQGRNALLAACTAVCQMQAIPRHGDGVSRINVGELHAHETPTSFRPMPGCAVKRAGARRISTPI